MQPSPRSALPIAIATVWFLLWGCATPSGPSHPVTAQPDHRSNTAWQTEAANPAPDPPQAESSLLLEDEMDWNDDPFWDAHSANDFYMVPDPLEKINRAVFVFNDKLYFWLLKPVAQGYRAAVPRPARTGIRNFFTNLGAPVRIINNILQGKGEAAEAEVAKLLYNTTVGVLGFGNPARHHPGLNPDAEDLGQTLARYGIGDGLYLVLPFLGPSTLRDSVGRFGDRWLAPLTYVTPIERSLAITAFDTVNDVSLRIGNYEALKDAALDPYQSLRDGYIQLRQTRIRQ